MSQRRSGENLPPQANSCVICCEIFGDKDEILVTVCSHRFHKSCLLNWLKRNSTCPQCHTKSHSRELNRNSGVQTRSRNAPQTIQPVQSKDL
ncbi:unnamed protein product, partial [Ceratitis capitata]